MFALTEEELIINGGFEYGMEGWKKNRKIEERHVVIDREIKT